MTRPPASRTFEGKAPDYRSLDADGWNGGPPPAALGNDPVTPITRFFTRNHAPVPEVDPSTWRLEVRGLVREPLSLSLADLWRHFTRREVPATLICAGFRRTELMRHLAVPGELPWGLEPAGTAAWRGVALRDVLMASGPLDAATDIAISGVDRVERNGATFGFGGSIPLSKAMDPDVVLADEMNGEPLPAVHGGPVRLVVPGYIGARSVKWVGDLEARDRPSENYFQTEAYRIQSQPDPRDPRSVRQGRALGETALNSVILSPAEDAVVRAGGVILEGWAIGGGGRGVSRVEVSPDGGTRWIPARVEQGAGRWTWQRWTATVNLQPGRAVLLVRAFDDTGAGQPDRIGDAWNVKGYGNNAWHRVLVWAVG